MMPPALNTPAQISLTDCLACSGCVTSAEAVLVSLQSHLEVLNTLTSNVSMDRRDLESRIQHGGNHDTVGTNFKSEGKVFVASVSPQSRASIAATFGVSEREAGNMIDQMLAGPNGIRAGGIYGHGFAWVIDTNVARDMCLVLGAEEVLESLSSGSPDGDRTTTTTGPPSRPILTSACPGWICYAEKTHPHILPHLSRLKSPQALLGTLIKTALARQLGLSTDRIWHLAIMPCFDKKLEASRGQLTDVFWEADVDARRAARDVDCVITTKELLMLAGSTGVRFSQLPRSPLHDDQRLRFPDPTLHKFLFRSADDHHRSAASNGDVAAGTSGGYLNHILQTFQSQHPGSSIRTVRGRNADIVEQSVVLNDQVLLRTARYYGFRNIQNLVRKLKPTAARLSRMPGATPSTVKSTTSTDAATMGKYAYIEVMACPGGCTNGGGQIKFGDVTDIRLEANGDSDDDDGNRNHSSSSPSAVAASNSSEVKMGRPITQKEWLSRVDEAYFSAFEDEGSHDSDSSNNGITSQQVTTRSPPDIERYISCSSSNGFSRNKADDVEGTMALTKNINGISPAYINYVLQHWSSSVHIPAEKLVFTTYLAVDSDVGKSFLTGAGGSGSGGGGLQDQRVVESLAGKIGGGW